MGLLPLWGSPEALYAVPTIVPVVIPVPGPLPWGHGALGRAHSPTISKHMKPVLRTAILVFGLSAALADWAAAQG